MNKFDNNENDPVWSKLYKGFSFHQEYPKGTMEDFVEETAHKYPNYIAYEYYGTQTTYQQFIDKIVLVAKSLKAIGVQENDRVTICMPNTPEAIISFYAVNMVGAIANMIHPLSSENEIEYYLKLSNSGFIITIDLVCEKVLHVIDNTDVKKVVVASASQDMNVVVSALYWITKGHKIKGPTNEDDVLFWKEFLRAGQRYDGQYRVYRKAEDLALILYSGGTTGKPKGILLSNINFNALAVGSHLMCDPSSPGDSILSIMPIFHSFGLGVCIHTPLTIGMKCIFIPDFKPNKFYDLIKKYHPNFIVGVPTLFEALLKLKHVGKNDLACLKCIVSGGDTLNTRLKKKVDRFLIKHGTNAQIREGYGLTEGSGASCLTPTGCYRDGSIGIPFPDVYYKIVKIGTHDECDVNEMGEICISGPTVMMGYLDDINETVQTLRQHEDGKIWLHTGDLGSVDKEGYIYFKQRLKRLIISSGYNVYPSYIEQVLNSHPDVAMSTVIGIDHPYKQQVAKAIIVLKDGVKLSASVQNSIKEHCELNLAKYSLPYIYEFRDSLPKTLVGKVSYAKLMEEENKK